MLSKPQGAEELRNLMTGQELLAAPGVYDGLSGRIAEAAGFPALYVSGGAIARSLGYPDIGLTTFTEMQKRLEEIRAVTSLPLIVDADTGYGNVINVLRTVRGFEAAGAAALHIEDQVDPKRCGHYEQKELIRPRDMINKIRAAMDARSNPATIIIARTDARSVLGLNEAIDRANSYAQAGADVLFIEAPRSRQEIERIASEVKAPLLINMFSGGKTPLIEKAELAALGYRIMIVPSDLQRAAVRGMQRAAEQIARHGHTRSMQRDMASFAEREHVVGLQTVQGLERKFMQDTE